MAEDEGLETGNGLTAKFGLDDVLAGLAEDLRLLRAGEISVQQAKARADLARQFFNGVRLVITGGKMLEARARALPVAEEAPKGPGDNEPEIISPGRRRKAGARGGPRGGPLSR